MIIIVIQSILKLFQRRCLYFPKSKMDFLIVRIHWCQVSRKSVPWKMLHQRLLNFSTKYYLGSHTLSALWNYYLKASYHSQLYMRNSRKSETYNKLIYQWARCKRFMLCIKCKSKILYYANKKKYVDFFFYKFSIWHRATYSKTKRPLHNGLAKTLHQVYFGSKLLLNHFKSSVFELNCLKTPRVTPRV